MSKVEVKPGMLVSIQKAVNWPAVGEVEYWIKAWEGNTLMLHTASTQEEAESYCEQRGYNIVARYYR